MLLLVVIPVSDEAETVPLMLARLRATPRGRTWEVIFVDDGSTDATSETLEQVGRDDGPISEFDGSRSATDEIPSYQPLAGVRA
jgi:glycosyltransferase involved in cell wall biosynthesis